MPPCAQTQRASFSMMNTRTPNCLMSCGLLLQQQIFRWSSEVQVVCQGPAGAQHVRSVLLVACSMVARTLVAHDQCGTKLTFDALIQKHVRYLHPHPNSVIFTNLSESLWKCVLRGFLGLQISDYEGRRNLGIAGVVHAGTSGALERFQQCFH